jgi:hypothetical protein
LAPFLVFEEELAVDLEVTSDDNAGTKHVRYASGGPLYYTFAGDGVLLAQSSK